MQGDSGIQDVDKAMVVAPLGWLSAMPLKKGDSTRAEGSALKIAS